MPLPGGDAAIAEPWRTAVAYLHAAFGPEWANLDIPFVKRMEMGRARVVIQMIERRVNTPFTTSTGRLFDAVASLLGICDRNTHEGQAPMELEAAAAEDVMSALPQEIRRENGVFLLDPRSYIHSAVERLRDNVPAETISAEFHNGLCNGVIETCERIREAENISSVALSGGVFQNKLLFERTVRELERKDFRVLTYQLVPPNDGCIALGQAAVARARASG
jgi:hydrogenase maturation protein HypF